MQPVVPDPSARGAWATPGAAAPQPSPGPAGDQGLATTPTLEPGVDEVADPHRRLVPSPMRRLRPRGVGEILDAGFDVLRHRPVLVLTMTTAVILPLYAVPTLLNFGRLGTFTDQFGTTGDAQNPLTALFGGASGQSPALTWLAIGGSWLANALVGLGVGVLVSSWLMGADPSLRVVLRTIVRRSPVLIVASLVALPIKGVGLLFCGIGVLIPASLLMVLSPVIAAEPVGPLRAVGRSWTLSARRVFPMIVLVVLGGFVSIAVQVILQLIGGLVLSIWDSASWVWIALGAVDVLIEVLLMPLRAAWAALAYVDLRVRTEGLDIELERTELFAESAAS